MGEKPKSVPLKRPRFFAGQMLSATDLDAGQEYFLERQRRHNRSFHGYGVVSGLDVAIKNNVLSVSDGMALDPVGNEIVVPSCFEMPIKQRGRRAYVIARYDERETDPVPVQIDSNGGVEFSRIEEAFQIVIAANPDSGARKSVRAEIEPHVILAKLVMSRGRWRVDPKFRRSRAR